MVELFTLGQTKGFGHFLPHYSVLLTHWPEMFMRDKEQKYF